MSRENKIKEWVFTQIDVKPDEIDKLVWNIEPGAVSVSKLILEDGNTKFLKSLFSEELPKHLRIKDNRKIDYPTPSFNIERALAKEAEENYHPWEQVEVQRADSFIYQ